MSVLTVFTTNSKRTRGRYQRLAQSPGVGGNVTRQFVSSSPSHQQLLDNNSDFNEELLEFDARGIGTAASELGIYFVESSLSSLNSAALEPRQDFKPHKSIGKSFCSLRPNSSFKASCGFGGQGYISLDNSGSPLRSGESSAPIKGLQQKKKVRFSQNISVQPPPVSRFYSNSIPRFGALDALAVHDHNGNEGAYEYTPLFQGPGLLKLSAQSDPFGLNFPSHHDGVTGTNKGAENPYTSGRAGGNLSTREKMLSYMLPVDEKVGFSEADTPPQFTTIKEDQSPLSESKPLIEMEDNKEDDKGSSVLSTPQQLESPTGEEAKTIIEEHQKEKDLQVSEDRSPVSDSRSLMSEIATPGSDDRSIIKTSTTTKPGLKR